MYQQCSSPCCCDRQSSSWILKSWKHKFPNSYMRIPHASIGRTPANFRPLMTIGEVTHQWDVESLQFPWVSIQIPILKSWGDKICSHYLEDFYNYIPRGAGFLHFFHEQYQVPTTQWFLEDSCLAFPPIFDRNKHLIPSTLPHPPKPRKPCWLFDVGDDILPKYMGIIPSPSLTWNQKNYGFQLRFISFSQRAPYFQVRKCEFGGCIHFI